jgi:hypothetical protein
MKKWIILSISLCLVFVTIALFFSFQTIDNNILWMNLKGISFSISLSTIFIILGIIIPAYKILPANYYKIGQPTMLKLICKIIGVKLFGKIIVFLFYNKQKIKATYFGNTQDKLNAFITKTERNEFGHFVPFLLISLISIYLVFINRSIFIPSIMLTNVLVNLYPVLLQRHHRAYYYK